MLSNNAPSPPSADPTLSSHVRKYVPQLQSWPYTPKDFSRSDETNDDDFYDQPRYVAHIDEQAIVRLTAYFGIVIPRKGRVLDFCTSWHSWYPETHIEAAKSNELEVYGIGMNKPELDRNSLLNNHPTRSVVADLNVNPDVRAQLSKGGAEPPRLDAATCTVSIDYLVQPVEVLRSLRECTVEGGKVHLVISNRCFPTKAVRMWLELDTEERLQLVGDYLHFAGWKDIEIVDLCARDRDGTRLTDENGRMLQGEGMLGFLRLQHMDPLWVVRGTK
ncbi:hypothetical protein P171DRAFT_348058 [Karstenula rhodostoma CBS 690.94]|uniref:Methyltransferase type 11 domain-containing protein n=1 Tax=Karstenula rhodostoma CBS 690.94 TaxID=1392251 RepID=A0A9P4PUZ8_9PLEO|nr:hypothetical protein P171DRAFT_348058 [Karstenula rhodostoma CBS 690.94]